MDKLGSAILRSAVARQKQVEEYAPCTVLLSTQPSSRRAPASSFTPSTSETASAVSSEQASIGVALWAPLAASAPRPGAVLNASTAVQRPTAIAIAAWEATDR